MDSCQTKTCLDTLNNIEIQVLINEVQLGESILRMVLKKANDLQHAELLPKINEKLSSMFYYQGAFDSSFYYQIAAIKQYEQMHDMAPAGRAYASLGYIYKRINLDKGFEYMRSGIDILEKVEDSIGLKDAYNNFGVLHEMSDNADSALYFYQASLDIKMSIGDSVGIPYSLENIALIRILNKEYQKAETSLKKALNLRIKLNDQQGLLGNYINLAELYHHKGEYQKSIHYFNKALGKEKIIKQPYAAQYCYEKLTAVYKSLGDYKQALEAHISYAAIKDSLSNEQNIKNVESLTIQYETVKKEEEIKLLSIKNQLSEVEVENANNRFYASLGGIALIVLTVFLLFNRYQNKQRVLMAEQEVESQKLGFKSLIEGEEKERKRIAQELHDGLGQLLSTARLNISAMEDRVERIVEKQWKNSIKLIDEAVTEVRHISHNMMPNALVSIGFEAALKEQIHIINDAGQVKIHAELPVEKIDLPESKSIALYRVIQEILNNALKYAEAKNIWLTITISDHLEVNIKDDGKGFDKNIVDKSGGIGWRNIKSRMDILNGEFSVDTEIGKGSKITLRLAV
ncbi:MAG: sensor histidine kinase [Reichenbachiella sp.]|uniref:tetratricopeptide repeat-containing sensor histidine kinase n=1 Tax=Reichenbachiella sp. TaxID=2184521 RepID=UPI0032655222